MTTEPEQTATKDNSAQNDDKENCCIEWILHIQEEANYTDSEDEEERRQEENKTNQQREMEERQACFMMVLWMLSWFCMIGMLGMAIYSFSASDGGSAIMGTILLFLGPIQHWVFCYFYRKGCFVIKKRKVTAKRTAIRATRMCCCGICECLFCSDD